MAAANAPPSSASSPPMQNDVLDHHALAALIASRPPLEAFGPATSHPHLTVETAAITAKTAPWLQSLPCPIIGIGPASPTALRGADTIVAAPKTATVLHANVARWPITAMILVQHLRAAHTLPLAAALTAESLAYAATQNGPEFRRWRSTTPPQPPLVAENPPLTADFTAETLHLSLADPANRNAIGTAMRDALCESLDLALATNAPVHLTAQGRTFSTGGEVSEFGTVSDPATAHWIRSLRLPATRLAQLSPRFTAHIQGAAIGAGIEIAAFAHHLTAAPSAWFQLPELKYGLIPGAGGTASITRRIGRHQTAYMALSMARIPARSALETGLIDAITRPS